MTHDFEAETLTFWVAHGEGALHFGELQPGEHLSTGLEVLETFATRRPWRARVVALGGSFGE